MQEQRKDQTLIIERTMSMELSVFIATNIFVTLKKRQGLVIFVVRVREAQYLFKGGVCNWLYGKT